MYSTPSEATTYRGWNTAVEAAGGAAVTLPGTSIPAARYPAAVFVPRVNARQWARPDAYSSNGQYGYYRAPAAVIAAIARGELAAATPAEIDRGAAELRAQWLAPIKQLLGRAGTVAAIGGALYLLWPRLRRGGRRV